MSFEGFEHPDENFVLHGRKTPIRMKSNERTYLTNSEKTMSSRNLSLTSLNRSASAPDLDSVNVLFDSADSTKLKNMTKSKKKPKSNGEFSLDLKSLNSSFNKSVSFNNKMPKRIDDSDDESLDDMFEEELQKLIDKDAEELEDPQPPNLVGKPHDSYSSQWFTEPVHLTKSSEYPVFESLGVEVQKTSPKNRTVGMLGMELAQQQIKSDILLDDDLVREYFPVTLGSKPSISNTISSPPQNGLSMSSRRPTSAKSEPRNMTYAKRPQSAKVTTRNPEIGGGGYASYLQASMDLVDRSLATTPNEYELAKLRMERLRLEEERILEMKRREELERIRGPTPKWYEMKTPHFTYEHFKHNQLLQSKKRWQELMDYRNKLTTSSKDFSNGHKSQTTRTQRMPSRASTSAGHAGGRFSTRSESSPVLRTASRSYADEFMHTTPVI